MKKAVDGLILRTTSIGESDRLLTVLTAEEGRISIMAKGARSMKSRLLSVCYLYNYVNLEYYEKNGRRWLSGGSVNDSFFGLASDLEGTALASYLCEIASEITGEGVPAPEILRMTLNSLYTIQKKQKPRDQIKAVYELFAAAVSGFEPDLSGCGICGGEPEGGVWLDVMNGRILCEKCLRARSGGRVQEELDEYSARNILLPLDSSALASMRYVLSAPPSRIFAFSLGEGESMALLCRATEIYLQSHLERSFDTLTFYESVKNLDQGKK